MSEPVDAYEVPGVGLVLTPAGVEKGASLVSPKTRLSRHHSLLERFWAKVSVIPGSDGCWEWVGACNANRRCRRRYPELSMKGRPRPVKAELVAFQLFEPQRELPAKPRFIKTCGNDLCVRPAHLRAVTALELAAHRKSLRPLKLPKIPAERPPFPVERYKARRISAVWTLERTQELLDFLVGADSIAAAAPRFGVTRQRIGQVLARLRRASAPGSAGSDTTTTEHRLLREDS